MKHNKIKIESRNSTSASVRKEMEKPRMAKSAREAELKMNPMRTPERPSVIMPGTVDKIIPSPRPHQPEKANIAVDGADRRHQELRIENTLIDEFGGNVKLKKGAHVEVTVSGDPKT